MERFSDEEQGAVRREAQGGVVAGQEVARPQVGGLNQGTEQKIWELANGGADGVRAERAAELRQAAVEAPGALEMDLNGDGVVSDAERLEYADALREAGEKLPAEEENVFNYSDRKRESLNEKAILKVKEAERKLDRDSDPASFNAEINDYSWHLVLDAFNRRKGDGLVS